VNIMRSLSKEVPQDDLQLKRLDALNSFVFNVDTPAELVQTYGRYYLRGEPLDTLERIQDAYLNATKQELEELAERFLDPSELQIFIVADKAIPVKHANGKQLTLEQDIRELAEELGLPYREIELR
jgi:predicted Zn-dependent peptidase